MNRGINLERRDGIGLVWINSPETANAVDHELGGEMLRVLTEISVDDSLGAVVLTGKGRTFSAGANVRSIKEALDSEPDSPRSRIMEKLVAPLLAVVALIADMPQPVVAAVNGPAAGGGLSLALACDLVVASDQAFFDPAYIRLGLPPVGGMTCLLPRLAGPKLAAEILLSAQPVSAARALETGLINRTVPAEQLLDEAIEMAVRLAKMPREAVRRTKRLLRSGSSCSLDSQMEREKAYMLECADTDEHRHIMDGLIRRLSSRAF